MAKVRIIARIDVKGPNVIKGVHLEGLKVVGDPNEISQRYYAEGIDELLYMDTVASLYGCNSLLDVVRHTSQGVFVPIIVGGGIRSVDDARDALRSGAEKVAVNTAAIHEPELLSAIAQRFGSQCITLSIEAKQRSQNKWEAYTENGRERTGLDVIEWAKKGVSLGAGEILLTSVDQEGTRKGFDTDLVRTVSSAVNVPVIASGGFGNTDDFIKVVKEGGANAVAIADVFHFKRISISDVRQSALQHNIEVRKP